MILPVCIQDFTPRLGYAIDLVVRQVMGFEYTLVSVPPSPETPHLSIVNHPEPSAAQWYDSGFLSQSGNSPPSVELPDAGQPGLCFDESGYPDLLASVFWLVTEYDSWLEPEKDLHGRGIETKLHQQLDLAHRPVVHDWVAAYETDLLERYPVLKTSQIKSRPFHEIVIDIDQPWKYRYKPLWVQIGGMLKDVFAGKIQQVTERFSAWTQKKDPNDTINELLTLCDPAHTRLFVLLGGKHPLDSRFSASHSPWRKVIQSISDRGFSVNIHPSYQSADRDGYIQAELQELETICRPDANVRMHFLRYRLPDTRREMLKAGLKRDYSVYRNGEGGFPCGMMQAFPWYDLGRDEVTDLWIVPTMLMDRTIVGTVADRSGQDPEQALEQAKSLLNTVIRGNGAFVLCLHNECLSESEEWVGWSAWARQLISIINNENSFGSATPHH